MKRTATVYTCDSPECCKESLAGVGESPNGILISQVWWTTPTSGDVRNEVYACSFACVVPALESVLEC